MKTYIKKHLGSIIILGILALVSFGSFFIDLNELQESIKSAGVWAPLLYIVIKSSTVIFAPLSGTPLYIFSVPLFGFWKGVLFSVIGDFIGAIITFYISRFFGRPVVSYFAGKNNMEYIEKALLVMGTKKGFITMRLAAISMPEIASYAAGLTSINFLFFIIVHMLVHFIPVLIVSSIGLIFREHLPAWLVTLGIISVSIVTIISIGIFIFMLKKTQDKNSL